jgi:hypothetical protein
MTDTNPGGWPDAARPGYPISPGRKGAHVLDAGPDRTGKRRRIVALWANGRWLLGADYCVLARDAAGRGWQYVGPCFAPAEVAALIEAVRREEREACARYCDERQLAYEQRAVEADMSARHFTSVDIAATFAAAFQSAAAAIRARGDA